MFDELRAKLGTDIDTLKTVLKTNEAVRSALFAAIPEATSINPLVVAAWLPAITIPETWHTVVPTAPKKTEWQIFDHCAAFTRLYAVFEQYISDLVTEYVRLLPELYAEYDTLDGALRTQHRVAVGQILQKWSEAGPYRHLTERGVVRGLAEGLGGQRPYSLLPDAFLIDPQNYRADTIRKIFGYLGFSNCWAGIQRYPRMIKFIDDTRDATETPETILHDIVEYRNGASHSNVSDVVSVEEIRSYAEFIIILCEALSDMLTRRVLRRRIMVGHVAPVGTVIRLFGRVVGVEMQACTLSVGDELIAQRGETITWMRVLSIGRLEQRFTTLEVQANEQIGIKIDGKVKPGAVLFRLSLPRVPDTTSPVAEAAADAVSTEESDIALSEKPASYEDETVVNDE